MIKTRFIKISFTLYSLLILWEIYLGPYRQQLNEYKYNIYPLKTIFHFINTDSNISSQTFLINMIGNIVVFIPFGFFLPIIFNNQRWLTKQVLLASVVTLFFIELLQMLLKVGVFDIDDIILNSSGIIIGFKVIQKRLQISS